MPKCLNVFFRKSARHLDFWRLGFSILLQKSVVYRPITSKEDSKGRRMDMAMIFSSSKRWGSIFFIFYITEPPRSPFIFDFCLMQPVTKFFIAFFGGSYVLRSSGAPWGAPYNYLKSWTWLRSVFPKQIILIIPTNNRYILNLYGILRFFTQSFGKLDFWGLREGLRGFINFTIVKYGQKPTKNIFIIFSYNASIFL